nr:MAG TPA: hypothetical protein [Inoviridae sp.]
MSVVHYCTNHLIIVSVPWNFFKLNLFEQSEKKFKLKK